MWVKSFLRSLLNVEYQKTIRMKREEMADEKYTKASGRKKSFFSERKYCTKEIASAAFLRRSIRVQIKLIKMSHSILSG